MGRCVLALAPVFADWRAASDVDPVPGTAWGRLVLARAPGTRPPHRAGTESPRWHVLAPGRDNPSNCRRLGATDLRLSYCRLKRPTERFRPANGLQLVRFQVKSSKVATRSIYPNTLGPGGVAVVLVANGKKVGGETAVMRARHRYAFTVGHSARTLSEWPRSWPPSWMRRGRRHSSGARSSLSVSKQPWQGVLRIVSSLSTAPAEWARRRCCSSFGSAPKAPAGSSWQSTVRMSTDHATGCAGPPRRFVPGMRRS